MYALVQQEEGPIKFKLTAGQEGDLASAEMIVDLPKGTCCSPTTANMRTPYARWYPHGAWANIPPKPDRKRPTCFSKYRYRARDLVERFFNKIEHFRRIALRYDKTAEKFLHGLKLLAMASGGAI